MPKIYMATMFPVCTRAACGPPDAVLPHSGLPSLKGPCGPAVFLLFGRQILSSLRSALLVLSCLQARKENDTDDVSNEHSGTVQLFSYAEEVTSKSNWFDTLKLVKPFQDLSEYLFLHYRERKVPKFLTCQSILKNVLD